MAWKPIFKPGSVRLVGVAAALATAVGMAALLPGSAGNRVGYHDDTHEALSRAGRVVEVRGEQGLEGMKFTPPAGADNVALDARRAVFTVANSRNAQPTTANDCNQGDLPVNRYPLLIQRQDRTAVVGGLFQSRVPQSSDWRATYCNSAAITFEGAPHGVVDGVRIAGAWDGIRSSRDSAGLLITNSWISNVRDDAVEDDYLQSVTIRDSLIDGAFQGISVKPRKTNDIGEASNELVTLSGDLLSLRDYSYKEARRFGALTKSEQRAPRLRVVNSVVAVDSSGGQTFPQYWATSWSKLTDSSNNLFLWLSDAPVPDFVPLPPSSFRVLKGQAARAAWTRARSNWINCHPRIARLPTDPRSNPAACVAGTWGGFTE